MTRHIHTDSLHFARLIEQPSCIPKSRPRGTRAVGLRYERSLAKYLPSASHGQWIEFEDRNGAGFCQPDFLLNFRPRCMVMLECKLSWTFDAVEQLDNLYRPVVEKVFGVPAVGVVVTKNLTNFPGYWKVCPTLGAAIEIAKQEQMSVWHWLGTPYTARLVDLLAA